jgi:hypothetical protein
MKEVLGILRRELDQLLHAIGNLNTDHGIHGYRPTRAGDEGGSSR